MKKNKKISIVLIVIVLVTLLCILGHMKWQAFQTEMRLIHTVQNLKQIAIASIIYQNNNEVLPDNFSLLTIDSNLLNDPATGKPFVDELGGPISRNKDIIILAKQVAPISISMWPWGEKKQYAAFSDGSVRNIIKQQLTKKNSRD